MQRGLGRVHVLLRGRLPAQGFLPVVIGLRLGERRLGRGQLGLRLREQGGEILPRDFKAELLAAHLRLGRGQRAFGEVAVDLVLARIDMDQRVALPDELIVGDIQRNHGARDLRRDEHRPAVGIGVVGGFDIAAGIPEPSAAYRHHGEQRQADRQELAAALLRRLGFGDVAAPRRAAGSD